MHEHARLMLVREQLQTIADQALPPATAAKAGQLMRLKGIGPVFAGTLAGELFWKDFKNRREVGAYPGLTPSPWRSGGVEHDQGISKAGNPRVRYVAIELAWLWLLNQPQSALSRWFHERVGEQRGRVRRIAIVALARKLVIALWRFLTLRCRSQGIKQRRLLPGPTVASATARGGWRPFLTRVSPTVVRDGSRPSCSRPAAMRNLGPGRHARPYMR